MRKIFLIILLFISFSAFAENEILSDLQVEEYCYKPLNAPLCAYQMDIDRYYITNYTIQETPWGYFSIKNGYSYDKNTKALYQDSTKILDFDWEDVCQYKRMQASDYCASLSFNFTDSIIDRNHWQQITDFDLQSSYVSLASKGVFVGLGDIDPNKVMIRYEISTIDFSIQNNQFEWLLASLGDNPIHPVNLDKLQDIRFFENIGSNQVIVHDEFLNLKVEPVLRNTYKTTHTKTGEYWIKTGLSFDSVNLTITDEEGSVYPLINKTTWTSPEKDYFIDFIPPLSAANQLAHAEVGAGLLCHSYDPNKLKVKKGYIQTKVCTSKRSSYTDGAYYFESGDYYIRKGYSEINTNTLKDSQNNWINLAWDNATDKNYAILSSMVNCTHLDVNTYLVYSQAFIADHMCATNQSTLNTSYNLSSGYYVRTGWNKIGDLLNDGLDNYHINWITADKGMKGDKIVPLTGLSISTGFNETQILEALDKATVSIKIAYLFLDKPVLVDKLIEKIQLNNTTVMIVADNFMLSNSEVNRLQNAGANITFDVSLNYSMHNAYLIIDDSSVIYSTSNINTEYKSTVIIHEAAIASFFLDDFNLMKGGKFAANKNISTYPSWLSKLIYSQVQVDGIKTGAFFSPNQSMMIPYTNFFIDDETPTISGNYKSLFSMIVKILKSYSVNEVRVYANMIVHPHILYLLRYIGKSSSYNIPVTLYLEGTAYDNADAKTKERLEMFKNTPNRTLKVLRRHNHPLWHNLILTTNSNGSKDLIFFSNENLSVEESGGKQNTEIGKHDESALFLYGVQDKIAELELSLSALDDYATAP